MPDEVTLSPSALRRLARLQARAEGAQGVAMAAMQAAQAAQQTLQQALTEECQEEGMNIPGGGSAPVDLDWKTGVVRIQPPAMGAPMPMPPGNGAPPPVQSLAAQVDGQN
jgi:hypothetical protein